MFEALGTSPIFHRISEDNTPVKSFSEAREADLNLANYTLSPYTPDLSRGWNEPEEEPDVYDQESLEDIYTKEELQFVKLKRVTPNEAEPNGDSNGDSEIRSSGRSSKGLFEKKSRLDVGLVARKISVPIQNVISRRETDTMRKVPYH